MWVLAEGSLKGNTLKWVVSLCFIQSLPLIKGNKIWVDVGEKNSSLPISESVQAKIAENNQ